MKLASAILFGTLLGVASLVAAGSSPLPTRVAIGPTAPLCPPDDTDCVPGGHVVSR